MFRLIEPLSVQIKTVLLHWTHYVACVNNMGYHTVHSLNVPVLYLYLVWWWFSEPKHVADILILITNICYVYLLNKLLNLLLFWNRVPSTVFNCSRNIGCFFCIRILELVNVGCAESLLALNLGLLLCILFSLLPLGFLCIVFVITVCTV